jgi:opacity protein-like surface antigen
MITSRLACTLVAVVLMAAGRAVALDADLGPSIDLAALTRLPGDPAADGLLPCAAIDAGIETGPRFYVAPIVGSSWATLAADEEVILSRNLFTAGGAAGMAFARPGGQARLEFEGRYRDGFALQDANPDAFARLAIDQNWSALVNLWRDVSIGERFGVYAGGGIGAGGYRFDYTVVDQTSASEILGADAITQFAWQAGGGLLYAVSDRITLDLGYRFYGVGTGQSLLTLYNGGVPILGAPVTTGFSASELLLSVRIYEPFRRWR